MPEESPLVSIITPAYNYADLISETIDSILAQDYSNIEYIVLDDGSTDNTLSVLQHYGDRIIWESHENMGEARTVNKGFEMASGDYLIVVNSDDPVLPGCIRTAVEFMENHPDVLVGYPRWLWIDENSHTIQEFPTHEYDYSRMLVCHHCYPGPGAIIRRKAIELERGRDTSFRWFSDYDFWIRVGLHGPFARIPYVLATQRKHPRARTYSDVSVDMVMEHIRTVENFYQRSNIPEGVLAVKRQAMSYVYYIAATLIMPQDWSLARRMFLKSITQSLRLPAHPSGSRRSWILMLRVILFSRSFNKILKRVWTPLKSVIRIGDEQ